MNVSTHNNIAMMSSMVGVPQQTGDTKKVNKDLDQGQQVSETDKPEESQEQKKDNANVNNQGNKAENVGRQQARQIQRRYVAEDTKQELKSEGKEAPEQMQDLPGQQKTKGVMLDTSAQIQFKFQKFVGQQQQMQQANNQAKMKPDVQRKQFAENLRKWVDVEYKQFVKQNDPLYTRKNLREILSALGEQEGPQGKKTSRDRETGKNTVQFSKFNKYNITKASQAMRIFEEIPSNLDNADYDLVA
jgi:hypothetical protein